MTQRQINYVVAIIFLPLLPVLVSRAFPPFNDVVALDFGLGASLAIAAISLNLLMGYTGQISLGHSALLGVGGFTAGIIITRLELPFLLGVVGAAVMGGAIAFLLGLPALRLRGLYLAIVTIAFGYAMENSIFRLDLIAGGSGGFTVPRPEIFGFKFLANSDILGVILFALVIVWGLDSNVVRTKLGRAFQVIRESESVAQSFGVNVARYKLLAFVLSGSFAGVAGAMYVHMLTIVTNEMFNFNLALILVVMVVVGGLGSRAGAVTAGFFFTLLPNVFDWPGIRALKTFSLDQVLGPALLIFTIARHPGGVAGALAEAAEKKEERRRREAGEMDIQEIPKLPSLPRPAGLAQRSEIARGSTMLSVSDLSVQFGGLKAVDEASLKVPKGQIVGLIGPNGAGKTTLFNAISGFVPTRGGIVEFFGDPIQDLPPHARVALGIGRTFQLIGLAGSRSVLENFLLAQHVVAGYGVTSALTYSPKTGKVETELIDRAQLAINALGFEKFTHTPTKNLSHGQQRLVELGCALVTAPELLLLDEPSAGMAPAAVENLAQRLKEVRDELGRTVLLIEHNIPLVLEVCDYIYVLNFGQILAEGTTKEIAEHPEVIAAYFGEGDQSALTK